MLFFAEKRRRRRRNEVRGEEIYQVIIQSVILTRHIFKVGGEELYYILLVIQSVILTRHIFC
jgi:hypothetical protein